MTQNREARPVVTPILTTKLHVPSLGRGLVPRWRLIERLARGLERKLSLISAPAGFGKTTLLAEWVRTLRERKPAPADISWLSLDEEDNDPARFFAYLEAALGETDERAGGPPWDEGAYDSPKPPAPGQRSQHQSRLIRLINRIAGRPLEQVLVLDDYHLITSPEIHESLGFLVDHLPENLHLALATRADPPLHLARLRAHGSLTELRQSELRFSPEEAAAFLNEAMGLDLTADEVAALEARTEGWIVGLQMAAVSLQGKDQEPGRRLRSEFVHNFTGSHRFVLDYLAGEVLDKQPPAVQDFLLKTSILDRLAAPLCDEVTGTPGASQSVLEHLEESNLFIVPLDGERLWYRYHHLFADLLRKKLQQTLPGLVPALHLRASAWFEQQGLTSAAIDHAFAAGDVSRAGQLVESAAQGTLARSEVMTFLKWVDRLPAGEVGGRPLLRFYHALALVMSGHPLDHAQQLIDDLTHGTRSPEDPDAMAGRLAALKAFALLLQFDIHRAAEQCRLALERVPESETFLRSLAAWVLSHASLAGGDFEDGSRALREVAAAVQHAGNPLVAVVALCGQARLQMRQGRLRQARQIFEQALRIATSPAGKRLPVASEPLIGLGLLHLHWNDLEAAAGHLTESLEVGRGWNEPAIFDACYPLARVRLAQGRVEAAQEALQAAETLANRPDAPETLILLHDLQLALFHAAQGNAAGLAGWAERRGLTACCAQAPGSGLEEEPGTLQAHLRKYEQIAFSRLLILQGRAEEALSVLGSLRDLARRLGRVDLALEVQILTAVAYQAAGDESAALVALAGALTAGEQGGYVRIFLDEGEPMLRLLRRAAAQGMAPAYVAKLLGAFGLERPVAQSRLVETPHPHSRDIALAEPLSGRELEVLRLLETGMTNPEIAARLVVAASTVRSHCKSIYGKLGVHSRFHAVRRARELGLI